jgi:cobalt-zinc-cadmium efflux system protein
LDIIEVTPSRKHLQLLWIVLVLRISLFLVELGVGLWSQSHSLQAGAGHVFSDLLTLGLTLLAAYLMERKSRGQKISSHTELEISLALLNGFSLLAIAFLITWETMAHLQSFESELGLPVLFVAGLRLVINSLSIYLLQEHSQLDLNVRGVFLHGIADAASSFGVMLSALTIYYWHWLWVDAATSLFVACLICFSAISLIWDSFRALLKQPSKKENFARSHLDD